MRMTTPLSVTRLVLAAAGTVAIVAACGSEPKKDPAVATAEPAASATPEAAADAAAAEKASTADAGAPAAADPQAECEALLDEANSTLDAERIAVDKLCKKDADCMPVRARACAFACVNAAIPKNEEKDWNESLTKVKDGACKKWTDKDCAKYRKTPLPTCQDKKVRCEKGHCALR